MSRRSRDWHRIRRSSLGARVDLFERFEMHVRPLRPARIGIPMDRGMPKSIRRLHARSIILRGDFDIPCSLLLCSEACTADPLDRVAKDHDVLEVTLRAVGRSAETTERAFQVGKRGRVVRRPGWGRIGRYGRFRGHGLG
jgi:hypothetical protein